MTSPALATGGCAFTLDVQWILDIVDRVKKTVERISQVVNQVLDVARRFLKALSGILDWFCWVPGLGKFAKSFVERACRIIQSTVNVINRGIQGTLEVFKHVLAPWEVRSAGKSIVDQLVPKCEAFALQYELGRLRSAGSWSGEASSSFFSSLTAQQDAAARVADGARKFGEAVHEMGAKGVETTVNFVTQYITAAVGVIISVLEMAAVPVGTALGAAQIVGLIAAIISYVMVWINAMASMISSMNTMSNAANQAVPGGAWPKAVV
ncbi:hypothetical protein G7085_07390 [Tessaracoccus sp. HDW20]|uniref:hypothetical protein n=1 Tax=Tessaracoccus coleopterorum TaxID=2714950 RepID=UPI0018D4C897|nr:hypothetical protein [Tessaracoccus coleopterorum]NHB84490.1 hypothetical protein [Tessaracoccus coleopterorum]